MPATISLSPYLIASIMILWCSTSAPMLTLACLLCARHVLTCRMFQLLCTWLCPNHQRYGQLIAFVYCSMEKARVRVHTMLAHGRFTWCVLIATSPHAAASAI